MDHGALDEVRALSGLGLPPKAPIMKALGVAELLAYLEGQETYDNDDPTRSTGHAPLCQAPGHMVSPSIAL